MTGLLIAMWVLHSVTFFAYAHTTGFFDGCRVRSPGFVGMCAIVVILGPVSWLAAFGVALVGWWQQR